MDLQQLTRSRPTVSLPDQAEIWDLASEEAGEAIETLAAETARRILAALYDEPRTASELAEATDNSLQNVNYHLTNLREAGLIEVADTRYSRKGTEMKIYAPTTNAVLLLSQQSTADRIKQLLSRLVLGIGMLAITALAFRSLFVYGIVDVPGVSVGPRGTDDAAGDSGGDGGGDGADIQAESEDLGGNTGELIETINPLEHLPWLLDPGVVFFLGGLTVLVVFLGIRWWRARPDY